LCSVLSTGLKLKDEDIQVIDLDDMIDLTVDGHEGAERPGDVEAAPAAGEKRKVRGAYEKDVMGRLVVPELMSIRKLLPKTFELITAQEHVDIVLAIDNTSRPEFDGELAKLEQAVFKVVLPGIQSAQQSPRMATPIFFLEGVKLKLLPAMIMVACTVDSFGDVMQGVASGCSALQCNIILPRSL
jgi:hypothetical protein